MMNIVPMDYLPNLLKRRAISQLRYHKLALHLSTTKLTLFLLSGLLLAASFAVYNLQSSLLAAGSKNDTTCSWHTVTSGETLTRIARQYHTTISTLIHANGVHSVNLIFVGQHLCIPHGWGSLSEGIQANGRVNWYDYAALSWSDRSQVHDLLCQAAASRHLPRKLVLAIAWQESSWTQHVIAWDGGIGVMQLMPYTAMGINSGLDQELDPYDLQDNIDLGTTYLEWLWQEFRGNLPEVISGYNEGGWSVRHRGIFNWHYVDNVLALMRQVS